MDKKDYEELSKEDLVQICLDYAKRLITQDIQIEMLEELIDSMEEENVDLIKKLKQ